MLLLLVLMVVEVVMVLFFFGLRNRKKSFREKEKKCLEKREGEGKVQNVWEWSNAEVDNISFL